MPIGDGSEIFDCAIGTGNCGGHANLPSAVTYAKMSRHQVFFVNTMIKLPDWPASSPSVVSLSVPVPFICRLP
jgi:hypothetical protein